MSRAVLQVSPDSARAVLDDVFAAEQYEWDVPPNPFAWLVELWSSLLDWLARLEVEHPGAYYALVVGLVILLIAILVHLTYLTVLAFRSREEDRAAHPEMLRDVRDAAWHLGEAKRLEDAGRFADSLAHRFAALVFLLDRKRVVRAHPSKTPGEYLREAQLGPAGKDAFAGTIRWLYDHLFGGRPLNSPALAEFDQRAKQVVAHGPA